MTPVQFFETVLSVSLQATVVIAICRWLSQVTDSDHLRCRVWSMCHVGLLTLIVLALGLPHLRLWGPGGTLRPQTAERIVLWQTSLGEAVFFVWAGGAIVCSALIGVAAYRMRCLLDSSERLEDSSVVGSSLPTDVAVKGPPIRFYVSDVVASPFCWQFHRPIVVLPRPLLSFHEDELDLVLRHEFEHLQTGHPLELFLQRFVEVIYWFHPLVWWASHQATVSRELACDEAAARTRDEIRDYLRALLKVIEQVRVSTDGSSAGLGLALRRDENILAQRARRLAQRARREPPSAPPRRWMGWAVLSATVAASLAWIPLDVLGSTRSVWSPWPTWTASVLHDVGIVVRDYEVYDRPLQLQDRLEDQRGSRVRR